MAYDENVKTPQGEISTEFGKMKYTLWDTCARIYSDDVIVNRVPARVEVHFKLCAAREWIIDIIIARRQDKYEDLSWAARCKVKTTLLAKLKELAAPQVMLQAKYKATCDDLVTAQDKLDKARQALCDAQDALDVAIEAKRNAHVRNTR